MSDVTMALAGNKTLCRIFMSFAIDVDRDDLKKYGLINVYLDDVNNTRKYSEEVLYFLFGKMNEKMIRGRDEKSINDFIEKYKSIIIDIYGYEDMTVIIFAIPHEFKRDYALFLEGRYSAFSNRFKNRFPKVKKTKTENGIRTVTSIQWSVFTKDSDLREVWEEELGVSISPDQELWDKPNIKKETLDITKVKLID